MYAKNLFGEFEATVEQYFKMGHAKLVPTVDLEQPAREVFYLPMHIVRKESSSTTKVRAVFDASDSSLTGVSLDDLPMVEPTVHSSLVNVMLRFRLLIETSIDSFGGGILLKHHVTIV